MIQIFGKESKEYKILEHFCQISNKANSNIKLRIEDIFFDYNSKWKWTTIIAYDQLSGHSWQYLSPNKQTQLLKCTNKAEIEKLFLNFR